MMKNAHFSPFPSFLILSQEGKKAERSRVRWTEGDSDTWLDREADAEEMGKERRVEEERREKSSG